MKLSTQRLCVAILAGILVLLWAWLVMPVRPSSPPAQTQNPSPAQQPATSAPQAAATTPAANPPSPSAPATTAPSLKAPSLEPASLRPVWDAAVAANEPEWLKQGELLYQKEEPQPGNEPATRRISIRRVDMKYPLIRVVEVVRANGAIQDRKMMVADHLMVQVKPEVDRAALEKLVARHGATIRKASPASDYYLVSFQAGTTDPLPDVVTALQKENAIRVAEPDYVQSASLVPNDTRFAQQWDMHNTGQTGGTADADIDGPEAWGVTQGSSSVVVAVIDTGIDYLHPDLINNMWTNTGEIPGNGIDDDHNGYIDDVRGWNFCNETNEPMDDFFHGTHCAGTIGASSNNGLGVAGVCWNVKLMALKFLNSSGSGFTSDAVDAVNYANRQHVLLTSNSWGGGGYSATLENAIKAARDAGILFVAAAGNSASNNDLYENYPSNFALDNVIAVAATDFKDALAYFSSYGATKVHIAAPGVNIMSTFPRTMTSAMTSYGLGVDYGSISGTSMATPHVAGVCALLKGFRPSLTAQQIRAAVLSGGDRIASVATKVSSGARLNATHSLELLDDLLVTPLSGLVVAGPVGGPFTPSSGTLTLANGSSTSANWSASSADSWFTISPAGGTLEAGQTTTITVTMNTAANALPAGSRTGTVTVQNLARGTSQTRLISLTAEGVAPMPFTENWETGTMRSYWKSTGFGWANGSNFRNSVTQANGPRGGYHLVMDTNATNPLQVQNEMTVSVNLLGYSGVRLKFAAKSLNDEPDGPPASPFIDHAWFDGVAVSADGSHWYEVQGLRTLGAEYQDFDVDLDAAVQAAGISYTGTFKVRFNHVDNSTAPEDGIAIDDIQITGAPPIGLVLSVPSQVREGVSMPCYVRSTINVPGVTTISLASASTDRVSFPASVFIPPGSNIGAFNLQAVEDAVLNGDEEILLTATAPGLGSTQASVIVQDNESAILSLVVPATLTEGSGINPEGKIVASKVPAKDITVSLASSNQQQISVPPLVTLPAGTTEVTFPFMIIDDQKIEGPQSAVISASVPNWTSASASVVLNDDETYQLHLALPSSLDRFAGTITNGGIASIEGTLTYDLTINLTSDASATLTVPAQVVIPAGSTEVAFDVTVVEGGNPPNTMTAQVSAASSGFASAFSTVTVSEATSRVWTLSQATSDLAYSSTAGRLIASVPASASLANGGLAFMTVSAAGASVENTVPVSAELKLLRMADDGSTLWAASSNGQSLLRINASDASVSTSIALGADDMAGSYTAQDFAVMPGAPGTIAVARRLSGIVPHHAGVVLFDNGAPRSISTPRGSGSTTIEFADPATLLGYDQEAGGYGFRTMNVGSYGVSIASTTPGLLNDTATDIRFDGGRCWSTSGKVIDPATKQVVGSVAVTGPVCPDQSLNRVCWLQQTDAKATLHVFDQTNLNAIGKVSLSGLSGVAGSLVRCGEDRVAFRTTGGQVYVVRTACLATSATPRFTVTPAKDSFLVRYLDNPSAPSPASYTLVNSGSSAVDWSAASSAGWLDLSATSGTLAPKATLTVSATPNNTALATGSYTSTLTFTNTTNGLGSATRVVSLDVRPPNTPPTVSTIAAQTSDGDHPIGPLAFTIGDAETIPSNLTLTASSSNQLLIPDSAIVLAGSGASRTITLTALPNRSGTSTITLSVSDPGATTTTSFLVTVNAFNDRPTISTISGQAALEDLSVTGVAFTISDPESPSDDLVVSAATSNPTLLPTSRIFLGGSGSNRTLSLQPMPNQNGSATVTLTVNDGALNNTSSFGFTVTPVNDQPTLNAPPALNVGVSAGSQTVNLSGIGTGAANETQTLSVSASSSNTAIVPNPAVSYSSPNSTGSLSFTPVAGASGSAVITVTVTDNGGTANGGVNQIVRTFNVRVGVPLITSISPASGPVGSLVTITGAGFDSVAANNIVYFGAVPAQVLGADVNQLSVVVPPGATRKPVSVTARGLTAWSSAPFAITFPNTRPLAADCFGPVQNLSKTIHMGFIERRAMLVDLDADGKSDIVAKGSTGFEYTKNNVSDGVIHPNAFSPPVLVNFFTTITGMTWWDYGDLDGDGKMEVVATGDQGACWFRNNSTPGNINLSARNALNTYYTYFVQVADLDQDGKPEIVTNEGGGVGIYRNTSSGGNISFASRFLIAGSGGSSLAIADMDGDGKPDIVSDDGSSGVKVFRNQATTGLSTASFAAGVPLAGPARTYSVCTADLDGDGRPEVMVTGFSTVSATPCVVSIFQNNCTPGVITAGSFSARLDMTVRADARNVDVADFDGNGRPDIMVANDGYSPEYSSTSIYMNYAVPGPITAASFGTRLDLFTDGGSSGGNVAGDLDGDGRPEIVTGRAGQMINVWKNQFGESRPAIISINPNAGPAGCQVVIAGSGFAASPAGNVVYIGSKRATVLSASTTSLVIEVPAGASADQVSVTVNGTTGYSLQVFKTTIAQTRVLAGASFVTNVTYGAGTTDASTYQNPVTIGDVDGDGKNDIIQSRTSTNTVQVYRNVYSSGSINAGTFAAPVTLATRELPGQNLLRDVDGDGKPDLCVVSSTASMLCVFRNLSTPGTIAFATRADFTVGGSISLVEGADLNADGMVDFIFGDNVYSTSRFFTLINSSSPGSISFQTPAGYDLATPGGIYLQEMAVRDFDGDGLLDYCAGAPSHAIVGRGIGTTTAPSFGLPTTYIWRAGGIAGDAAHIRAHIQSADMDGDGKPDIIGHNTASSSLNLGLSIGRNVCTPGSLDLASFAWQNVYTNISRYDALTVSDLDGDGRPDITLPEDTVNKVAIFQNFSTPGNIGVGTIVELALSHSSQWCAVGDLTGDGKKEIVASGSTKNLFTVFQNNAINIAPTFQPVAAQTVLEDHVSGLIPVSISDVGTPLNDVVLTVTSSNQALLPASGIVTGGGGAARTLQLSPLPDKSGQTTITVQASDGSLAASTNFILTVIPVNDAPTIAPVAPVFMPSGAAPIAIPLSGISTGAPDESQVITIQVAAGVASSSLLTAASVEYVSPGTAALLNLTPSATVKGSTTVTVTVSDNGGTADGGRNTTTLAIPVTVLDSFDWWRRSQWTDQQLQDQNISGDSADPHHTGMSNLMRYAMKLGTGACAGSGLSVHPVRIEDQDYATFSYRRRLDDSTLIYGLECSSNLKDWSSADAHYLETGTSSNGDGTETVTLRSAQPLSPNSCVMLRLKVSRGTPP